MKRIVLLAKGNVDVHDSLHSCRIGGKVHWNGINELLRGTNSPPIRLRHETWTRSDAILAAQNIVPPEIVSRSIQLGAYPATSQFGTALFETGADAIIISVLGETATTLARHRKSGFLFYPADSERWDAADRAWLREDFERLPLLDVETSIENLRHIIARIRAKSEAPILVYNVSAVVPGEMIHNYQGLEESYAVRCQRFNLGLVQLSSETGISIIDVDGLLARSGADRLKIDAMHLTPEGYRLVSEEVVKVLSDIGVIPADLERTCALA